jgi:tetrahydromethanopterin S-methyltransferase subunit G
MSEDQSEIRERLARIETKVDSTLDLLTGHDGRLHKVEGHINKGYGIVATLTLALGVVGQWFWEKLNSR